jgi:pyrroline-5-carboxylate reductase
VSKKTIGFVGTGTITEAMVRGLLAEPAYVSTIHVSPRNAEIATRLAADFRSIVIVPDNQAVIDSSDMVCLAIRPQIAEDVIRALKFRPNQSVLSVIAATDRGTLQEWIQTDVHLIQAIPLPFVANRQGVTAIYPPDAEVADLFDTLGRAVQCASNKEYDLLAAASALMSTYFGFMAFSAGWLEANGLERSKGQVYLSALFHSLAQRADRPDVSSFEELSTGFATVGGLNEQVLSHFGDNGGGEALKSALDSVLARIEGPSSR